MSACNCFFKSCFQQLNYKACQDIYESFKDELKEQIKYSPKNEIVTFCFLFKYSVHIIIIEEEFVYMVKIINLQLSISI